MGKINTEVGIYKYTEKALYLGGKKINKKIAKENLLILKNFLDKNDIEFSLIFGTLLGAVREKDFIAHDEDTDLFILEKDKKKLLNILFNLRKVGFEVVRYERQSLLSIMRQGEYIDFYIFEESSDFLKCGKMTISAKYFKSLDTLPFLGGVFNVPINYKEWLKEWYGETWHTPRERNISKKEVLVGRIKSYMKILLPSKIVKLLQKKNKEQKSDCYF